MTLSQSERLVLYNQYEILKQLSKDEHDIKHYEAVQTSLQYGYSRNYFIFSEHICEDEFDTEKMDFVYSVLDMYRCLNDSYNNLAIHDKEQIDPLSVNFPGFDGNNECEYLTYVEFLINELDLYSESKRPDLNTHARSLRYYEKMLPRYHELIDGGRYRLLTLHEIKHITEYQTER